MIYHVNTKQNKDGVTIVIAVKVHFKENALKDGEIS